jgi:hypothetical protein
MTKNAYTVPLSVFRNRCWAQSFSVTDEHSSPVDLSRDSLALVVLPTSPVSGSVPLITNTTPTIQANTAIFDTPDSAMSVLTAGEHYSWQFLRAAYSSPSGCTAVVTCGPLNVTDSPPFPY